jgi:hypothetical protein
MNEMLETHDANMVMEPSLVLQKLLYVQAAFLINPLGGASLILKEISLKCY